MGSRPILFYDSGAGGLPYLSSARARLPGRRYVYLADRKSYPLGEKPPELLRRAVLESISLAVERFDPVLVVIACNTASVIALDLLREHFPIPFVGVVPAVKPAALSLQRGSLAMVATHRTASAPYLDMLIREFADGCKVLKVPVANLVDFAEFGYLYADRERRLESVRREIAPLLGADIEAVVLGCTHFVLLEQEFRAVLPEHVTLIDSREGVTSRVVSLVERGAGGIGRADLYLHGEREKGEREDGERGKHEREDSERHDGQRDNHPHGEQVRAEEERYRAFADLFDLNFRGRLEEALR
jgi:glutamate racemase